jgi:hypothetical protein
MTPSTISPDALKQAEERWHKLRDAGDPGSAEAESEFQRLARAQTTELQTSNYQNLISRMLK